ncbi:DUF4350 domain-containing protein [Marinifilum caeruleilacunae]|uniref:DUF4350 domain-containing protein n=1 Tax=Marinifilum caeruleilacunae TaxID=2499076 RepID=A0ABX1WTA7_9BACT|nr:DUF4350 domain-containing protein [Marinifilum caeruleilacunae]NOU59164.1 hypothetical protein [Marinifilum caeruleilacunae]
MKYNIPKSTYPFIAILILLFLVELFAPRPIDWTQNFNADDKRPFGSYLIMDLMKEELFPNKEIEVQSVPVFNYPREELILPPKNYIYITNSLDMKDWDVDRLIKLAEEGNQIFIAASSISFALADTLGISITPTVLFENLKKTKRIQSFENRKIAYKKTYKFEKAFDMISIDQFHKDSIVVLGRDQEKNIQFVKKKFGKGNVFFSCQPLAFTNYNVLADNNADYIAGAFSYLPNNAVVWDEYYKPTRLLRTSSPIRYLLTHPPLKLGIYLLLICLIFLLIFQGKRQERIVPVVKPLRNTSLDFIQTLGTLYYTRKNHKDIAVKKFKYFKEYIRSRYHIDFKRNNIKELSSRSGLPEKTLLMLLEQSSSIESLTHLTQEGLEDFHSKIEYIYKNCN